jgi:hypothetical protein
MNKIDSAWAILKSLPPHEQEIAADAILDYAAAATARGLSDVQSQVVERRLQDADEQTTTPAELRTRIEKLLP